MRVALGAALVAVAVAQAALGQSGPPIRPGQPLGQRGQMPPQRPAPAQNVAPPYVPPGTQPAAQPGQPAYPRLQTVPQPGTAPRQPVGQPPVAPQSAPTVPFVLTQAELVQLDRMLQVWEQSSAKVKTFDCKLKRWHYDPEFNQSQPDQPISTDLGELKYAAPDRGAFKIEGDRAEHWICDGKSIFHYNYAEKQLVETPLAPEFQGEGVRNGPIPFLFGAKADEIKQRYFVRLITPPNVTDQVWLEAYPRYQQDAANFHRVELILTARDMQPAAIQIYKPDGRSRDTYTFYEVVVNDPLRFIRFNPFSPSTPLGWKKVTETPPTATRPPQPQAPASARQLPPGSLR